MISVIEEISRMSKTGSDDKELLEYVYDNYNEIECELNGDKYKEPKSVVTIFALTVTWKR